MLGAGKKRKRKKRSTSVKRAAKIIGQFVKLYNLPRVEIVAK
jgi:hypothetical protein